MKKYKFKLYWPDGNNTIFECQAENETIARNYVNNFLDKDLSQVGVQLV